MSRKYLIDTSALYPMLLKGIYLDSSKFAISSLTEYEIGNVLWKEAKSGRIKDPDRVARIFEAAIKNLEKHGIKSIESVLRIALDKNLTFYDASYLHIAEIGKLVLITQDADLMKKAKNAITVDKLGTI